MPKRHAKEKIEYYQRKLRKLEEKHSRRASRIITSSDEEHVNNPEDTEYQIPETDPEPTQISEIGPEPGATTDLPTLASIPEAMPIQSSVGNEQLTNENIPTVPDLDPDILAALGEITNDAPEFGERIHDNLAKIWLPLLKKGMTKENRDTLIKKYLIPENCPLLQAPKLNLEILAALPESGKFRDKKMTSTQQQLGVGITAINRGLNRLVNDESKVDAIKSISDGCRILSDLHYQNTEARIKFIVPGLDKSFLQYIESSERDNTLFGNDLSEKIKASKTIAKQGQQIKKTLPTPKPSGSSAQQAAPRSNFQGNWPGPSRYQSNRGGRGGYKRTNHRAPPVQTQTKTNNKPRVPSRR